MTLMLTKECACRANTHPVLNADDLHLTIVLLAELFWKHASASLWLLRNSGGGGGRGSACLRLCCGHLLFFLRLLSLFSLSDLLLELLRLLFFPLLRNCALGQANQREVPREFLSRCLSSAFNTI